MEPYIVKDKRIITFCHVLFFEISQSLVIVKGFLYIVNFPRGILFFFKLQVQNAFYERQSC